MLRTMTPETVSIHIRKNSKEGREQQQYMHVSHRPGHGSIFHMILMLIDGIGLGMIAVCTVFEGIEDYQDALQAGATENPGTILCFVIGICLATIGLIALIFHAGSFEAVHAFEHIGMTMLTVAPLVNMVAWQLFDSGLDPTRFYNRQWMATEVIELIGMTMLCISFIDADRHTVLVIELVGFFVLMIAAMFTVNIHADIILPEFIIRLDHIHIFDTCGLILLCVVSAGQWHMKGLTIEYEITHPSNRARLNSGGHHGHRTPLSDRDGLDEHSYLVRHVVDENDSTSETDV
jgi:hypothetical protein